MFLVSTSLVFGTYLTTIPLVAGSIIESVTEAIGVLFKLLSFF